MSNVNIFQNPTKSLPKKDSQIVRVSMEESEIGGRRDHMPAKDMSPQMSISHVPNAGTNT